MELKQIIFLLGLCGMSLGLSILLFLKQYRPIWGVGLLFFALFLNIDINLFFQPYRGTSFGVNIGLLDAVIFCLLIRHVRSIRPFEFLSLVQIFFLGWTVLGFMVAERADYLFFEWVKYAKALAFFWVLRALLRNMNSLQRHQSLQQCILALIGLQLFNGGVQRLQGVYRLNGSFEHSNDLSIVLNTFLPFLFAKLFTERSLRNQITYWICFLGSCACIVMTRSRAGWATMGLGLALSFGCLILRWILQHGLPFPKISTKRLTIVCTMLLLFGTAGVAKFLPSVLARIREAPKSSAESRHKHNEEALIMAKENIVGVGLNNYVLTTITRFGKPPDHVDTTVAHHLFYLTAAETGFIGLFLFLLLPLGALLNGVWALFLPHGLLSAILSIGTLMALVQSLFEPVLRHQRPLYLWMMTIIWSLTFLKDHENSKNDQSSSQ